MEPCPACESPLSENIQKRVKKSQERQNFYKASQIPKITLDIEKLDSISPNSVIIHTNNLLLSISKSLKTQKTSKSELNIDG
jgi:hypothetical protein